jgi:hypothetical protein
MNSTPPTPLSHGEIEELLGVYALDAVDRETAAIVEEHLDGCIRCSIDVAEHHEVAGMLANSGGVPSAPVWDGIAGQLGGTSDESWGRLAAKLDVPGTGGTTRDGSGRSGPLSAPGDVIPLDQTRRRSRFAMAGAGLVAAAAAVVAVAFGVQASHLHTQVSALQAATQLSTAERSALLASSTKRIMLSHPSHSGSGGTPASIVLTAAGTGFVVNDQRDGLARLPAGHTYQLWAVVGNKTISLGLLGSQPSIVPFSVAGSPGVLAFAITNEVAGGVVASANQPVAFGTVRL